MGPQERRKPLPLTIEYRGGAQCWYEIKTRGGVLRIEGSLALVDVMELVYRGHLKELDK